LTSSAFFTGKRTKSSRESLITFIGGEIAAVCWREFRIYPKELVTSWQPLDVRSQQQPQGDQ
jgi:hypothetical protein